MYHTQEGYRWGGIKVDTVCQFVLKIVISLEPVRGCQCLTNAENNYLTNLLVKNDGENWVIISRSFITMGVRKADK